MEKCIIRNSGVRRKFAKKGRTLLLVGTNVDRFFIQTSHDDVRYEYDLNSPPVPLEIVAAKEQIG